jgi:D-lyxose ketol-isomerase
MKRSEINALIDRSIAFFDEMKFKLPRWGYWSPDEWTGMAADAAEIVDNMLGWDLTDFGGGDFATKGLILFTLRNGNVHKGAKTYAEKIMIVEENQETPMHFHWSKMEDIINRGGGNLVIELYGATEGEELSDKPLRVTIDGITRTVEAGGTVVLTPGESICLEPRMYHRFYGEEGRGTVLVGEVSSVNDDTSDNRFLEPQGRFPDIVEDQRPGRLLATDYAKYL